MAPRLDAASVNKSCADDSDVGLQVISSLREPGPKPGDALKVIISFFLIRRSCSRGMCIACVRVCAREAWL